MIDYNWPWEIPKGVPVANFVGARKKWPKKRRLGGQRIYKEKNIYSIVLIIEKYLDINITIIF